MKVGATTSALLSLGGGGVYFSEILRPGGLLHKAWKKLGRTVEGGRLGGGKGEIDDARFSRGKERNLQEIQTDPSDLCAGGPMEVE